MLSFYSWDTDERQVLKSLDFAATLASMTRACTLPDAVLRLQWHTLYAAAMSGKGGIDQRAVPDRRDRFGARIDRADRRPGHGEDIQRRDRDAVIAYIESPLGRLPVAGGDGAIIDVADDRFIGGLSNARLT